MSLFYTLVSLLVSFSSAYAAEENLTYLKIDEKSMILVTVSNISDPNQVCYRFATTGIYNECDGYTSLSKLHKILNDGFENYKKLGLTSSVLHTRFFDQEKTSNLLRYNFMTEDGYIGFMQGPGYSWDTGSRFYDTTKPSDAVLVMSPADIQKNELIKSVPNHTAIGKSWKEDTIKFTVLSVFSNGLAEVGESVCLGKAEADCGKSFYTISLRKLAK